MKTIILAISFILPLSYLLASNEVPSGSLVVTSKIEKEDIHITQAFSGTLYYATKSKVAAEIDGKVDSYSFYEGQSIKKGETLVSLDSQILQANIQAKKAMIQSFKANLEQKQKELNRSKVLLKSKSTSQSEYDLAFYTVLQFQAQKEAMDSELLALTLQLEKTHIKAPFDAVVVEKNIELGQWVSRGSSVATVIDPKSIEVKVNIPAQYLENLHNYQTFVARIGSQTIELSLKSIVPLADTSTRSFPVEFTIAEDANYIEGMRVDIDIPLLEKKQRWVIARDALVKMQNQDFIFTVVDAKAVMIPVKIVGYKTNKVAIEAQGLSEDSRVIIKGNERIGPNMPIFEKVIR